MKEALLYEKLENNKLHCFLCNHNCVISEGKLGFCLVRENIKGILYTHSYANIVASHIDPIEKKPLFHFLPGTESFSIAAAGCNFRCGFCQNWQISQIKEIDSSAVANKDVQPEEIVRSALMSGCKSISYTYTEPTIFFEYALETARLAKTQGLKNVFVTNGYMTNQALGMLQGYIDAANVDLKSFSEDFYHKVCSAHLKPVLENIRLMKTLGIWVEITTLIVPGQNDSQKEIQEIASFVASVGKEIPWHISRFHPDYKMMDLDITPLSILKKAEEIGKKAGLRYVYIGNIPQETETTFCYNCSQPLIERVGYNISANRIEEGLCAFCHTKIEGVY